MSVSLAGYLADHEVKIDGDPFDLDFAWPLRELYDEIHPHVVVRKGAQGGWTAWAIASVIERMRSGLYPRGVLYGFPTVDAVYDFSQSRFSRFLEENADLWGDVVKGTNRTDLKRVGEAELYFRGIRMNTDGTKPVALLSIPVDLLVLDEVGEMDPAAVDLVRSRLDSSELRHEIDIGHPSIPGYGIDAMWEASDQRHWMIPCHACGKYTCIEQEFPTCIARQKDGTYIRVCVHCQKPIDLQEGAWQPLYGDRKTRGYWWSQLLSVRKPLEVIVADFETNAGLGGVKEARFWNMVLGLPFADLDDAIDAETILSLCDPNWPQPPQHPGPSFMGADVGVREIHWCIGHRPTETRLRAYFGSCETFDELYDVARKHHVECCVIDAMAETRAVQEFKDRAEFAWGCRYVDGKQVDPKWTPKEREVKVGRTYAMDASHRKMIDAAISWPRNSQYFEKEVVPMLTNLARMREYARGTGQAKTVWHYVGTKNDHWRHALAYAWVASERVGLAKDVQRRRSAPQQSVGSWLEV